MTFDFEDEDELIDSMWDDNLPRTPKWTGRKISEIRDEFWRQTLGDNLDDEIAYLTESRFFAPKHISDISSLHKLHPTDQEIRDNFKTEPGDGSIFLYVVHCKIKHVRKVVLVGFHPDIPGGEWEYFGTFESESNANDQILKYWHAKRWNG